MSPYREPDFGQIRTVSIGARASKVDPTLLAHVPSADTSFHGFLDSLPHILAADLLRRVASGIVAAHRAGRGVVLMAGGHVIKVGLGPLLAQWVRTGIVTHVAFNGASAIHDFELAAFGGTSEDVESGLKDGTFGMAEETGRSMNARHRRVPRGRSGPGGRIGSRPRRHGPAAWPGGLGAAGLP